MGTGLSGITRDYANMAYSAYSTDAALAAAVNTFYFADISGFSADRTLTLPATAAVGDRVGLFITTGDNAFEFLITATAGDTLNGIAGGTEWSRLFITNEVVILRCIVANTTWVVEYDGRIPQKGHMYLSTQTDLTQTAATYYLPTDESGAWTATIDVGNMIDTSTSKMTARRAGSYYATIAFIPRTTTSADKYTGAALSLNGTTPTRVLVAQMVNPVGAGQIHPRPIASDILALAAGDTLQYMFRNEEANLGAGENATVAGLRCTFALEERL